MLAVHSGKIFYRRHLAGGFYVLLRRQVADGTIRKNSYKKSKYLSKQGLFKKNLLFISIV
jgi:hypothetical protein